MITVNMGANVNGQPFWSLVDLYDALHEQVDIICYKWQPSRTEATFVAAIERPLTESEVLDICERLKQDCIAQYDGEKGELLGPKAAEWGPFNRGRFVTL